MILTANHRGATTVAELLAAVVVSFMTMAAIYHMITMQNVAYNVQNHIADMEQTVESVKTMMLRELEMAGYRPVQASALDGIALDTTQLRIRADLNGDGDTGDALEDITYRFDALQQAIVRSTGGKQIVFPNIESLTLSYLRTDGSTPVAASEIRQVNIIIVGRTAKPDPTYNANNGYRTLRVQFAATPRNLAL
jgi:hypothetical protein